MTIMECHALSKRFGENVALDALELILEPGHIVGLLGPNGSGKTTLIKLAAGLPTPTSGCILIGCREPSVETKAIVSYLPERIALPTWMNSVQAMDYYGDFFPDFRRDRAEEMLRDLGLSPKQRIREMSKGTREKLQLILTMSREAKLYLLDEPIGGVDPATRDYILRTIISAYDPGATILISTHLIADVEPVLDDVIFLKEGRVVLHDSAENLRAAYGMSVDELFREVFKC